MLMAPLFSAELGGHHSGFPRRFSQGLYQLLISDIDQLPRSCGSAGSREEASSPCAPLSEGARILPELGFAAETLCPKPSRLRFWNQKFQKFRSPSSSGPRPWNLPLCTYVPRKHQGKEFINISKYIEIRSHKHRDMPIDNYHAYSFKRGKRLYSTTEGFPFSLCSSILRNPHLVYQVWRARVSLCSLLTGKPGQKKIMLLNGSSKMPKTVNPKTIRTSPFIFPAKNCWLFAFFPMGEMLSSFLSSKPLASQFTTEYNFKHAKSGSSQNCNYIKITDRVKADGDSKQEIFIHWFVLLVMQQTFTGSFIYRVQTSIGCSGLCWPLGI